MTDTQRIEDVQAYNAPAIEPHNMAPWPVAPLKNLAAAFVKAQGEIAAAVKDSTNPAFKGSKYADITSVIDAIRPALAKNDLGFIQEVSEREAGGVYVETLILHKSGETYRTKPLPMPAPKQDPHGYGTAITYAKRYALLAVFGVPSEDDDGNKATEGVRAEQRYPTPVQSAMRGEDEIPETDQKRLRATGQEMIDLVNQEEAEGGDNSTGLLERVEPLPDGEYLWLWDWLKPHSRVRTRIAKLLAEQRGELQPVRNTTRGQVAPGTKKVVFRDDAPKHPAQGESA